MSTIKLALIGNPNCGKSSLFNFLTGLHQKTGNFAGVTVDKISGNFKLEGLEIEIIDLPGTYSLHPLSQDEHVVLNHLINSDPKKKPDAILYIADSTQLDRQLLLYSQVRDLGIPVFLAFSMKDYAEEKKIILNEDILEKELGQRPSIYSVRDATSLIELKKSLSAFLKNKTQTEEAYQYNELEAKLTSDLPSDQTNYGRLLMLHHGEYLNIDESIKVKVKELKENKDYDGIKWQVDETLSRFETIEKSLFKAYQKDHDYLTTFSFRADRILTNSVWGPLIFLFVMFLVFQAIFTLAEWPMNGIDQLFGGIATGLGQFLPDHALSDMVTEGVVPGIAGVVIFIPQIALLFFLIALLEESGYMSRAVFLFDRFFQKFGLNGRSLIALVSASACAIPAVMSARSIKNEKERLITIFVAPLMSCSARTPVYIVLITFIISQEKIWGWISLQGLVFIGFYLIGLAAVLIVAWVMKLIFKTNQSSILMLELPEYKWPNLMAVVMHTWHKVKSFIVEAGKVILVISMILWFLASYGPRDFGMASSSVEETNIVAEPTELEDSFAGHLGKWIEPVIKPLGFDWKIGIALITSFAAREVFVGTMATIYSVGDEEDFEGIQAQMKKETRGDTIEPVYTQATALSLVVFYIFAMQCMSTLAVVRKETGGWKWPIIQFVVMSAMAYIGSLLIYQWLS